MAGRDMPIRDSAWALERLTGPDSLLEPNITELLSSYLRNGGNPVQVVTSLSANYRGLPEMYRLLTDQWVDLFNLSGQQVSTAVSGAVRERLEDSFDAAQLDKIYTNENEMPEWLAPLLEDQGWRKSIYRLSERNPDCVLLNAAIQRIAESANRDEIAGLTSASSYFKVFSEVFFSALQQLIREDDAGLGRRLTEFEEICCRNAQTYIFSQAILYRLAGEPGGRQLQRLSKALEVVIRDRQQSPELVRAVRVLFSGVPIDIANVISGVLERKRIAPGDVMQLYRAYTSESAPSVEALRDAEFLDVLLSTVFTHPVEALKQEIRGKYIWLLALATSAQQNDQGKVDTSEVQATQNVLQELQPQLPIKYTQATINAALKTAILSIDLPIASMAVQTWLRYILLETPYYETYFRVTDIPAPLLLLEEMTVQHPQQRDRIFDILRCSFEMTVQNTSPQTQMALRRTLLDRMVAMMYHGYIMPVLDYMNGRVGQLDESLFVHFSMKTLGMFKPPYRTRFYAAALSIYALATDALLRQPTMVAGATPVGHSRSLSSSAGTAASIASAGTLANTTSTVIPSLVAPADDAATRARALDWLHEFIDHPPATRSTTSNILGRNATSSDASNDADRPLTSDEYNLLMMIRSKLSA